MADTPAPDTEPTGEATEEPTGEGPPSPSRRARLIMTTAILVAVAAVIVIVILLVSGGGEADDTDGTGSDAVNTDITSPYDVHELAADTGPSDVEGATLVSISVVATGGEVQYYGLSSDTEPAKAIIQAFADAKELGASEVSTTLVASGDAQATGSTVTFLLPDRGTLTFEYDAEQGIIWRSGQAWQVEGDLAVLMDAAVTYQQQQ